MIDWTIAFIGGIATAYLLTWPGLIALCVFGVLFEHNGSRGLAVLSGLIALATAFFFFDVSLGDLAIYAVGYLVIGLVWSFWRYKRWVTESANRIRNATHLNSDKKKYQVEQLHPTKNLDTISAWIIIWPFSFLSSVTGDLIDGLQMLIKKVFRGVYHKMYVSATADILEDCKKDKENDLLEA